jgi:hypothetical protein
MRNFKNNGTDKGHGPAVCGRPQCEALPFSDRCHYEDYELKDETGAVFPYFAKGKDKHDTIKRHHMHLFPKAKIRGVTFIG